MTFESTTQFHMYALARSLADQIGDGDQGSPAPTQQAASPPTSTPEPSPAVPGAGSLAPTQSPATPSSSDGGDANKFIAVVPFVAVILCFLGYRCFRNISRKREQYLLNLRSAQADHVLGDMQMIPSDDPDSDLL